MAGLTSVILGMTSNSVRPPLSVVIVIGWPEGSAGKVNLIWKEPLELALISLLDVITCPIPALVNLWSLLVIGSPLKRSTRVSEAEKPVPLIVSCEPDRPWAPSGSVMTRLFWTSKLPLIFAGIVLVVISFTPLVAAGTTNLTWKTPVSSVVIKSPSTVPTLVAITEMTLPSKVNGPTVADSGKPVPVT